MKAMKGTPTAAKHRIQFLAAVYSWAYARDICSRKPGKAYVEDRSYYFALEVAKALNNYLYPIMILAYCCRARIGEISRKEIVEGQIIKTGLKMSDITDEGIHIHRSKGSLPEVTLWSDFLREGYQVAVTYSKLQDKKSNISRFN